MRSKIFQFLTITFISVIFFTNNFLAQQGLPELRVSPQASITQNLGFAKIAINYSRPGVKGREIWGKLAPYGLAPAELPYGSGEAMPWRAGADENTTIALSHEAKINEHLLPAGTYGLFMIPGKEEWTIILSKEYKAWGSYFYKQADDVLRFNVKPQQAPFQEWLSYGFENLTLGSCDLFLQWEKIKVPFKIEFDAHKIALDYYKGLLKGESGFSFAAWAHVAGYCLNNNYNLNEGLEFINKSIQLRGNSFDVKIIKANLLIATGKNDEGNKLLNSSLETANENELISYGFRLINSNKAEDAVKIFELFVNKNPESWFGFVNLGRALNAKGDKAKAKVNFEKALKLAPENQKARIESFMKD